MAIVLCEKEIFEDTTVADMRTQGGPLKEIGTGHHYLESETVVCPEWR